MRGTGGGERRLSPAPEGLQPVERILVPSRRLSWFTGAFPAPTPAQARGLVGHRGRPRRAARRADRLRQDAGRVPCRHRQPGPRGRWRVTLKDETQVVYVSPLKALSNDIRRNLEVPLAGIAEELARARPARRRDPRLGPHRRHAGQRARAHAPAAAAHRRDHAGVAIRSPRLRNGPRRCWRRRRTVIVDEIHAVAPNKRGTHLALSLERLDALCRPPGCSASDSRPRRSRSRRSPDFLVGRPSRRATSLHDHRQGPSAAPATSPSRSRSRRSRR